MEINMNQILRTGKLAAIGGLVGLTASKIIESVTAISEKEPRVRNTFVGIITFLGAVGTIAFTQGQSAKAKRYRKEREADGDLYAIQREADARLVKAKAEVGVYKKHNSLDNGHGFDDDPEEEPGTGNDEETGNRTTWIESFKEKFSMPTLPPFLAKIMTGVPAGYEEAMLLHLLSMLGALCFSKVRAKYLDGIMHAANLQVVVEGNWGTGKAKFEQMFKVLFERVISMCKNKMDLLNEQGNTEEPIIIQTTGIGTSMSKYVDMLAENQECHMYIFNSEVRALFYDLKKGNGLNFDFLRKAFENGDVCRNNKARDSKNGIFSIFLNYTLTGTPADITSSFKKELEGGTLSRIAWTCIPEAGRNPGTLRLPEGRALEALRDQIDNWTDTYCYQYIPGDGDKAVPVVEIDLDYVCKALKEWNDRQYDLSQEEHNPARKDVRMRMAAIAFHCAIVLHMLFDQPAPTNWQKRNQVVDLTLFIADYCIERFLHKFGKEQNMQRKANQEAEYVGDESPQTTEGGTAATATPKVTDIAKLKELHDKKDAGGQSLYGWDKLAIMSGMSASTVKRKVRQYEAEQSI
jgi:hypothetical protein